MHDILQLVISELRGSWRFRWTAAIAAWVVCVLGWLFVYNLPDTYESRATVYVDTNSALKPILAKLTVDSDVLSRVEMVSTALLGRPQLEKVARDTDLHLRAVSSRGMDALIARMRQSTNIANNARREPNLFVISYTDIERKTAHDVVESLLNTFVEDSLGANRQGTQKAQQFLRDELKALEAELIASENELAEFKKKNVGQMPGEGGGYYTRLQFEMTELEEAESALRLAQRRADALKGQFSGERPAGGSVSSPQSEIDIRIAENQRRLEELQLRFTDLHPDVVASKATIEQLKAQKQRELDALMNVGGSGAVSDNPVYQNIQIELTNVNVEIATLREKSRMHNKRIADLRELVDILPVIEAELARLTRDYDVKQNQYQTLRQRLEVAELSESAEQSDEVKFRIIDPPTMPISPTAPNRSLLIGVVLLVGLGAGGAAAFLRNQLLPVFSDAHFLRQMTGVPILGSVQKLQTADARQRRATQLATFGVALFALFGVFVAVFLFQNAGSRLIQSLV